MICQLGDFAAGGGGFIFFDSTSTTTAAPIRVVGIQVTSCTLTATLATLDYEYIQIVGDEDGAFPIWRPVFYHYNNIQSIDGLRDVAVTNPEDQQVLSYNGTEWVNAAAAGGVTELNDLTDVFYEGTSADDGYQLTYTTNSSQFVGAWENFGDRCSH